MQRVHDNGHVYKGLYEGWYCPKCADFKTENEIAEGNTCPIHGIPLDREHEENWFFALSTFEDRLKQLYADRPDWITPRTRANEALAFINGGLQDVSLSPREDHLGRRGPVGPGPRLLRLVRRAAQLLHGALLRPRRRGPHGPVLAGDLPHPRQGHPQVPRRLLAGDADGRRPPAARARAHPRLPADARRGRRGAQDVQVAGQRARPVRGDGRVRHGRAALLLLPRGLLRAGRRRLDEVVRGALPVRAGQRLRQPRQPHAGDDRALPRRRRARGGRSTRSWPPTSTGCATRSASCSTARRSRRRSTASGSACAGSTATSASARRGSSPRTRPRRPSST